MHKQAAAELRQLLTAQKFPKGAKIFGDLLPTMEEFKSDLKRAGIPFLDGRGRRADFHSLRHTFATSLQISGVGQRELMELMGHPERKLSDHLYKDSLLLPFAQAVDRFARLPGQRRTNTRTRCGRAG